MKGKFVLALAALFATSACYAQSSPPLFPALRARMQPTPITASPVSVQTQHAVQAQPAVSSDAVPAQFAGHHHRGGCSTCGGGYGMGGYASGSGCNSCGGGGDYGFAGDCCPNYMPYRSTGLWNNYCNSCGGHGHFGKGCGGCGHGHGRCCFKTPIGMYGVTPYGCCLAGTGFGCGCNSGCGSCTMGCGHGCRKHGWRWGAGGYGCDGSCDAGCTSCAAGGSGGSYDNNSYDGAPANGVPTPAPQLEEAPPTAPTMDPPSTPTSEKSARLFPKLFPGAY